MQRTKQSFAIAQGQFDTLKQKMLSWCKQFGIFLFLDSNQYASQYDSYECLLAVGNETISLNHQLSKLDSLYQYHLQHKDWLFGHIAYDYKNELESRLSSNHVSKHQYDNISFFCPAVVCSINKEQTILTIESLLLSPVEVYQSIITATICLSFSLPPVSFQPIIAEQDYIHLVEQLRKHIEEGDCYEINFCGACFSFVQNLDTLSAFNKLNTLSPAPFAAYYRLHQQYMMCASPERYLRKTNKEIIAQPIKGTARRSSNVTEDNLLKNNLRNSIKEQAENVMIVDLMRNDLSRSCDVGSIEVKELFGIYSFPQVHQMISTISGQLKEGVPFTDAIKYSFPMGSMTGAPKIKVMELIEQYEQSRRALFSGTVGYITPSGDFDFNVIIRSLFYNESNKFLSYQTGGAITYDSNAKQEYDEMRLKAKALEQIFSQSE